VLRDPVTSKISGYHGSGRAGRRWPTVASNIRAIAPRTHNARPVTQSAICCRLGTARPALLNGEMAVIAVSAWTINVGNAFDSFSECNHAATPDPQTAYQRGFCSSRDDRCPPSAYPLRELHLQLQDFRTSAPRWDSLMGSISDRNTGADEGSRKNVARKP